VERQQLRWVAVALAALVAVAASLLGGPAAGTVVGYAAGTVTWLVPVALGAAVLRYRLYDLDRVVGRTLAYGLLTVLLGGGYAGMVLGLGQLLGQDSPLVVAAATLAVAAAFQPARRRVQQAVDRRFERRRYDAARTIAAFSARLRQEVDLDTLAAELLTVVEQTMQPTQASLWLRPSHPGAGAGAATHRRSRPPGPDLRPVAVGERRASTKPKGRPGVAVPAHRQPREAARPRRRAARPSTGAVHPRRRPHPTPSHPGQGGGRRNGAALAHGGPGTRS
jgi:hypothetical protein